MTAFSILEWLSLFSVGADTHSEILVTSQFVAGVLHVVQCLALVVQEAASCEHSHPKWKRGRQYMGHMGLDPRVCKPWFPNRGWRLLAERRLN